MKNLILTALLVMSTTVFAKDGNEGGGGGNLTPATAAQVKTELADLLDNGQIVNYLFLMGYAADALPDAEVRVLLNKINSEIVKLSSAQWNGFWKSRYILKSKGGCVGADGARQASVSANEINSTICYSLQLLTKIPAVQLRSSLVALTAHEISHQFGANETLAKKFEAAFSGFALQIWRLASMDQTLSYIQSSASQKVDWLKNNSPNISASNVCYEFGEISGKVVVAQQHYIDLGTGLGYSQAIDNEFHLTNSMETMDLTATCKLNDGSAFDQSVRLKFANYFDSTAKIVAKVRASLPFKGPN